MISAGPMPHANQALEWAHARGSLLPAPPPSRAGGLVLGASGRLCPAHFGARCDRQHQRGADTCSPHRRCGFHRAEVGRPAGRRLQCGLVRLLPHRPYGRFTIDDRADIETTVLLILVGVAVSEICLWGRRQQAKVSRESGYLSGVLSAAEQIGAGSAPAASVIEHVQQQLVEVLGIDTARFQEATSQQLPTLEPDGDVTLGEHHIDVDRQGLADLRARRHRAHPRRGGAEPVPGSGRDDARRGSQTVTGGPVAS
jgi:hypothetical protein